jgi:hypothetical protein
VSSRVDINSDPYEVMAKLTQMVSMAGDHTGSCDDTKQNLTAMLVADRLCFGDDKFGRAFKENMKPEEAVEGICGTRKQSGVSLTSICDVAISALESLSLTDKEGEKAASSVEPPKA